MKNKSWKLIVTNMNSTYINEEYEYSHEKAERVSLPHKNARIQIFITATKTKKTENKNKDAPRITHII